MLRSNNCKGNPAFVRTLSGFNPAKSFFSTSEIRTMGIVLVENIGVAANPRFRYFQHPTWRKAGWLAPIQLDGDGNIFTAPAPFISVLDNPLQNQNSVYKVDAITGLMDEFIRLPFPDSLSQNNAYGIIAMVFLCQAGVLYISTVLGSDRFTERGAVYAIDLKSKEIIDRVTAVDVMGMGITYITGKPKLFFGTGRSSTVYSIDLKANGKFAGKPIAEFTLAELGPRGDDKVRRIRTNESGNLLVHGIEFNYNLIAPHEKQETVYSFEYDGEQKKWVNRVGGKGE